MLLPQILIFLHKIFQFSFLWFDAETFLLIKVCLSSYFNPQFDVVIDLGLLVTFIHGLLYKCLH